MASFGNHDLNDIGTRLKILRTERRLSMRELSSRSGVTVSHISNIESSETSPTIMTLNKLLEALDVSVADFFGGTGRSEVNDRIVYTLDERSELKGNERIWSYLFPSDPEIRVVMTYEEYSPRTSVREPELHHCDVCGFVISGELTIEIPEKGKYVARSGEAFYLKAGTEHYSYNDGDELLNMVVVELKK